MVTERKGCRCVSVRPVAAHGNREVRVRPVAAHDNREREKGKGKGKERGGRANDNSPDGQQIKRTIDARHQQQQQEQCLEGNGEGLPGSFGRVGVKGKIERQSIFHFATGSLSHNPLRGVFK